jgi:hypothetical protein
MALNNNKSRLHKNVKPCPNHCRTWIAYNEHLNRFVEVKSGEIHRCPKWKPNPDQQHKTACKNIIPKRVEVASIDTIDPAIAGILSTIVQVHSTIDEILRLIRKLLDSITKYQRGIR